MSKVIQVEKIQISSNFAAVCWPVVYDNTAKWDPRDISKQKDAFKLTIDKSITVNILGDCQGLFSVGDNFQVKCDVEAGKDFGNSTILTVAKNGVTATFYATGGVDNGHLAYQGAK